MKFGSTCAALFGVVCASCLLTARADGLLAVDNPAKNGSARGAYFDAEMFEGNDIVAERQFDQQWGGAYSPRAGENIRILDGRVETGVQWNGFRLGALARAEGLGHMNRDTADMVHQYDNNLGYDPGRTYGMEYSLTAFAADGMRLSKSFALAARGRWNMSWGVGASLLQGTRIQIESASGQAVTVNGDNKDFNASGTLDSINDAIDTSGSGLFNAPYGQHPSLSGQGYAVDVGVQFKRDDGLRLEAAVNDLLGSISWSNVPEYTGSFNNNSAALKYYDANGYAHYNPPATAQSSYASFTQVLTPKVWMAAAYPLGSVELQAGSSYTVGYWFPELGVGYQLSPSWRISGSYDTHFGTVGARVEHPGFYFAVRSDNVDLSQAKAYGISGGFVIPF